MEFDVTIEIPRGNRNKYEIDHETGRIRLDRRLFTSMAYPADYGYIEHTLGEDGDPLDAILLIEESVYPGVVVEARPVAVFKMTDEAGGDDKVLCVVAGDPRTERTNDLEDVEPFLLKEIQHFFETYKALEPGKSVEEGSHWVGRDEAEKIVGEAIERAKSKGLSTARWAMPEGH
ncbi:inorganic diphosphatase [Luteipulveratus mongoliensis]|uniref:Inorganic pyrophosphatase n=1 Tax=Luteipulveratus mongoliensis TaxID=571913 RepID=A0A0K1JMZ7_9MICO|nr:inorganic diphosphatase [Luteipulveratus mongoliensis]AKU18089.1 inorganic pyrophosphatase [Luteipulveratus mongoliensis]